MQYSTLNQMRVGWLDGFLWHKVHKGHTAPDNKIQTLINKRENKKDLDGVSHPDSVKSID